MRHYWVDWAFDVRQPDTEWDDVGGVYIFCRSMTIRTPGTGFQATAWFPLFIGHTDNFKTCPVGAGHERWEEAVIYAVDTIHVRVEFQEEVRARIAACLIRDFDPPINRRRRLGRSLWRRRR